MAPTTEVHPKVKAGGIAGSLTILLVFIAAQLGIEISAEIASALTTVITFAASYIKA